MASPDWGPYQLAGNVQSPNSSDRRLAPVHVPPLSTQSPRGKCPGRRQRSRTSSQSPSERSDTLAGPAEVALLQCAVKRAPSHAGVVVCCCFCPLLCCAVTVLHRRLKTRPVMRMNGAACCMAYDAFQAWPYPKSFPGCSPFLALPPINQWAGSAKARPAKSRTTPRPVPNCNAARHLLPLHCSCSPSSASWQAHVRMEHQ